ncbi:MAG: copper resistance protein CopC [Bacillota bacterium]
MHRHFFLWLLLVALLGLMPAAAEAHAVLVQSFPSHGQRLDKGPPWMEVRFNEPVSAAFTPLRVQNSRGERVDLGDSAVDPNDRTRLEVSLSPLPPGLYTATYRVTSLDGHPVEGVIAFTVGDVEAPVPERLPGADLPKVPPAVSIVHGLVQLTAALLAGLTAFLTLVWLPESGTLPGRRVGRWAAALLLLLLGLGLAEVSLYAVRASGEDWSAGLLLQALTRTGVGRLWLARAGLGVAAGAALALSARARSVGWRWMLLLPGGGLLLTLSLQSHAVATREWLPVLADWLHLVAVSPWVGGLAGFALVLWPLLAAQPAEERDRLLERAVGRFSRLALTAVVLLTATGIYGTLLHLPGWEALWTTAYGRSLLLKVLLLLPVLGLAAYNLRRRGQGRFRQAVAGELALLVAIFVAAGFLTSLPPARVEQALRQGPFAESVQAGGLTIELTVTPNRLGFNGATIRLTRPDGTPEQGASAGLRLTMLEHEMGLQNLDAQEAEPGLYTVGDLALSMDGEWRVEVVVLTRGGREIRYPFQVLVPAPPSP